MATRTTRKTAATAQAIDVDFIESNTTEASHESDTPKQGFAYDYLRMMGVEPSRAATAALVIGTLVQVASTYLVWDFLSGMAVIALLGTGSMFLTFLVSLIAAVIAAIVGGIAGPYTFRYIASGKASEHIAQAKGFFGSLFGRKTEINAA